MYREDEIYVRDNVFVAYNIHSKKLRHMKCINKTFRPFRQDALSLF